MTIKTITIKKRGGGTRKQKVMVLKSGKFKFIKNTTKTTPKKRSKSTTKRRTSGRGKDLTRKTIKRKSPTKTVAAKKKGILENIPVIKNPTFKKAALGVGTATLGATVLTIVAPSIAANPIVKPVLALAGGGVPGVIAQVLAQGGLQGLGFGGNGNGGGINPGFA